MMAEEIMHVDRVGVDWDCHHIEDEVKWDRRVSAHTLSVQLY